MRKRTSKRRWKARARLGKPIPRYAIVEHRLDRVFHFEYGDMNADVLYAALGD